jgi:glyceraldehyde 3-phosphate dehydrogenase
MPRIALNGLGRIGKLVLRDLIDSGAGRDIVLINDAAGDAEQHALLMEFDSVHGRWRTPVSAAEGALVLNGQAIRLTHARTIEALPLAEMGVDLVVDATGVFKSAARVAPYYAAGVRTVVVSAPVKDGGALNLVYGVNHHLYDGSQPLVTAASCTTNCLAPAAKIVHDKCGIIHGVMTTIHSYTTDQVILDQGHKKELRRSRAAGQNIIPTTTGAAKAVALVIPDLKGKFDGLSLRVPTPTVSIVDFVATVEISTTKEELNATFIEASKGALKGILGVTTGEYYDPLVSMDFKGDSRSSIVDLPNNMVMGGNLVKVMAWYDNEWGYSNRLAVLAALIAGKL